MVWLQALYISFAIQRGGFGVGSVEKLEQLARGDPYNASIIGVDTAAKESHRNEIILIDEYDRRGLPRPLVSLVICDNIPC